ncbi:MAG: ATP-dependent zinc metalloprotease FtsH [Bacteroidia bacterium]|nr:ATP-dependent zinc metalloprotease FtsH [Bacteroidia bacterium]
MSEENKNTDQQPDEQKNAANLNTDSGDKKEQPGKKPSRFPNGPNRVPGGAPKNSFNFYWLYAVVVVLLLGLVYFDMIGFNQKVYQLEPYDLKANLLKKGYVSQILIVNEKPDKSSISVEVTVNPASLTDSFFTSHKYAFPKGYRGPHFIMSVAKEDFTKDVVSAQKEAGILDSKVVYPKPVDRTEMNDWIGWVLPVAVMIILWIVLMRRMTGGGGGAGQIFNIGKSKAVLFDKEANIHVTFNDVAGLAEAKVEVMEIVDFLKNPKKYTDLGAKIPKGALLVGPPGTGKTLLAKAVAGEAKVPFFSLSGSDFVEMFVGVGASRVRDLFKQAKEKAPCIVFIDEIDAVGRARGKSVSAGANDERENTLNQLLTEMDGFGTNSGVIILAATNRADILDRALLRPGRFDRQIYVDMPDMNERKEIFMVHLKPLKLDNDIDIEFLAKQTPGFSGADIANICNEAALIAARKDKKTVNKQDFLDAVDRIIAGLEKKNKIITPQEKKVIAYHEAGHATVSWMCEFASPLVKVTIVPRGRSLGAAWYLPDERQLTNSEQLQDEMCAALGGRAAEDITFGKISTGALSDLEKVTKQAYASIVYYGLNPRLGNISYYDSSGQNEFSFGKPYSEYTAQIIDEEVKKMIEVAYKRTRDILLANQDKLVILAQKLLEKEVIFRDDLETIFGKRPFDKEPEVIEQPVV